MTEIFKDIPGYEGKYQISNIGKVKGFLYHFNRKGYLTVTLFSPKKTLIVHRIVAKAFIPTDDYVLQVNHINGIKNDNRVENLEWTTCAQNVKHSYDTGLACNKGERHPRALFSNDDVLFMRMLFAFGQLSIKEIAAEFSARYDTIWRIIKRKNFSHI